MTDVDFSEGCTIFKNNSKDYKHRCSIGFTVDDVSSKILRDYSVARRVTFAKLGIKEEKTDHGSVQSGASWNFICKLPVGGSGTSDTDIGTAEIEAHLKLESGFQLEVNTTWTVRVLNVNGIKLASFDVGNELVRSGKRWRCLCSYDKLAKHSLFVEDSLRFRVDIEFTIVTESAVPKMCTPSDLWLHSSSAMFNSPKFSDFKLQSSDGKVFHVQKLILKFRSDVFAAMFDHKLKETETGECVVPDVDGETLEALLKFLYGLNEWKPQLAEKLIVAADKYQILDLVDGCTRELISQLNGKNVARMLKLADQISVAELKQAALKFIVGDWEGFNKVGGIIELAGHVELLQELKDFSIEPPKRKKQKTTA